ncbi:MAG: hypothetical protein OEW00_03805 [candidate division Zixibacteria bacterium]|nr:hypothetical protein [candidate division Zixibacteria bacterium]
MKTNVYFSRITAAVMPAVFLLAALLPIAGSAQTPVCTYDKKAPSLENARHSLKMTDYVCAEAEVNDFLALDTLSLELRADAHVLLAAVYYAKLKNESEQRREVLDQFKAAFRVYREWGGELDIKSPQFQALMEQAKQQVEAERTGAPISDEAAVGAAGKCPSSKTALLSTGFFLGATGFFLLSSSKTGDKWDDYEADPLHPDGLYDDYKSASNMKKLSGGLTIVTGAITGYLWFKYFKNKKNCRQNLGLQFNPTEQGFTLTYSF